MADPWLAQALSALRDAGLQGKEARDARWQAFEVSRAACAKAGSHHSQVDSNAEDVTTLIAYDEAMLQVAKLSGNPMGIGESKKWLRSKGSLGRSVASRLAAAQEWRVPTAHPAAKLLQDIEKLGRQQSKLRGEVGEASADSGDRASSTGDT